MRIALLYDNFVRDYRGLLLLAEYLKQMGHTVWIKAGWDNPISFCQLHKVNVLVTGQIAEWATHHFAVFCKENDVRLVVNTSEPIVAEVYFPLLITFNAYELNQDMIDLQGISIKPLYDYIIANDELTAENKYKYKLIGFPRTDITAAKELRTIEEDLLTKKYNLKTYNKKYLFISSFLLDGAFDGVPEQDLMRWNFKEFQVRNLELLNHTTTILRRFLNEYMGKDDVLIIKKHPWDCSSFFKENFAEDNCVVLDNHEFITSCINISDQVIHTYSTSAIEAWLINKPTVSIYLEKHCDELLIHMKYERIAFTYEQFISIIEADFKKPCLNMPDLFAGFMDGKATYRLAEEISKLIPKKPRTSFFKLIRMRAKSFLNYELLDRGLQRIDVEAKAQKNTKLHDFLTWENQRHSVNRLYKKPIKEFVRRMLKTDSSTLTTVSE